VSGPDIPPEDPYQQRQLQMAASAPPPDIAPPDIAPPVASFTYSPPDPSTQTNTTFDATASTPGEGETITAWDWLFNNQVTRSGQVVTWRLPSGHGDYDATLTITDSGGSTDSTTQVITI
jgi:PKD repeat protein